MSIAFLVGDLGSSGFESVLDLCSLLGFAVFKTILQPKATAMHCILRILSLDALTSSSISP